MIKKLNDEEFQALIKSTTKKRDYTRLQAIYLFKFKNKSAEEAAEAVGTTSGVLYQWSHKYNIYGVDSLIEKFRGGRKSSYMSLDEEKALLDELREDAEKGLIVISKAIQTKAGEKLGKPVSHDYATDLLNRHNWRKIVPRPKNPKSSKQEQEDFKKNSRI
jgi:transposase